MSVRERPEQKDQRELAAMSDHDLLVDIAANAREARRCTATIRNIAVLVLVGSVLIWLSVLGVVA